MSTVGAEWEAAVAVNDAEFDVKPPPELELGQWGWEILASTPEEPDWLIPGILYPGAVAMIAAREKTGKGTLILNLLDALAAGKSGVFGPAASGQPVRCLVYTEEPVESVREKIDRQSGGGLANCRFVTHWQMAAAVDAIRRKAGGNSVMAELLVRDRGKWELTVALLVEQALEHGLGAVFIDNVSRAAGIADEAGVELSLALAPLSVAAKQHGLGVIIDHHHRKAQGAVESLSRGGTATAGAVEVIVDIQRVAGDPTGRARKLSARGRLRANNWTRHVALSEDGLTFALTETASPAAVKERTIVSTLQECGEPMTVAALVAATEQSRTTVSRWLDENVGRLVEMAGKRGNATLYALSEREPPGF